VGRPRFALEFFVRPEPNRQFRPFSVEFVQREAKMSQIELWEKATQCTRAMETTGDPIKREMLAQLRTLWINLANESQIASEGALAAQVEAVTQVHADFMRVAPS
jgi:hypothetical protein